MATEDLWGRFRRWRRHRPFWGGLILVLSALELFFSANLNLNGIEVHLGPQGFLSYLLPLLLLICGLLTWFSPAQRLFYGIVSLLTALYTFVGLNLGGFFVGMLLGIVGGALVIAWGPPRVRPGLPAAAAEDDAPIRPATRDVETTAILPGLDGDERQPRRLGRNPRALSIGLIAIAVTASFLVAGSRMPASALDCPAGLPSRSSSSAALSESATPSRTTAPRPTAPRPSASASTSASVTPSASAPADDDTGNPVVDGFHDFIDGVGNLLGIGGKKTPAPSASPTPSPSASPTVDPAPTKTTKPSASASKPAGSPGPTISGSEIPCLGGRVYQKIASADDVPQVPVKPGLMEVNSLTMYNSTYDGVVDMPTASGSFKALKFSMDKAVNKPFSLTINETGKAQTVIKSNELITDGTVRFYTPSFKGKLFGLIPVTFTPEQPPPLTLPVLWFTDVTIQLAYVRCDVLTADPMRLSEKL